MSDYGTPSTKYSARSLGLAIILTFTWSSFGSAQNDESAEVRTVREVETDQLGVHSPGGIAFVQDANAFHIIVSRSPSLGTDFIMMSAAESQIDSARIAAAITDPINTTFDNRYNRLLILQSGSNYLTEVAATADGRLDPSTLTGFDARHFGVSSPQGMTVDPETGHLFILDGAASQIVRIEPAPGGSLEGASISRMDVRLTGLADARGIAFDPSTGNLHVLNAAEQTLYALNGAGRTVASRDLSSANLVDPQGLVFAPSGDLTDDPTRLSLYIADSGSQGRDGRIGKVVELSWNQGPAPSSSDRAQAPPTPPVSSLVQTIDTSALSPPSPDTAGITYIVPSDRLLFSDSEVNEMTIFTGVNLFDIQTDGTLIDTTTTTGFSNEPTGVAYNPTNAHIFISDDDRKEVYEIDAGADSRYGTVDDTVTSFDTLIFGSNDPEGLAYDSWAGVLFIVDGQSSEAYRVHPGANGVFDGVDDQVTSFDTAALGATNPEGIAFNTDNGHLYIVGNPDSILLEVTTTGALVQTIDISAANSRNAAGLAYAPGSLDPGTMNIYIAERGIDNSVDPLENDGRIFEMTLPAASPSADLSIAKSVDNTTPDVGTNVVFTLTASNAGPTDATVIEVSDQLPSGYTYVSDDGSGAYDDSTGVWAVGDLVSGASATLNITAAVNPSGFFTNTAQISSTTISDPDPSNDQDNASTFPKLTDLSMAKSVDNPTPDVGGFAVFTLTVTNGGPSDATGVSVTDQLPSGYTYASDDGQGAYNAGSGIWTIGDLANGASANLNITATVNPSGDYTNIAEVSSTEHDPNAANDVANAATTPSLIADLSLAKSVDDVAPSVGGFVVFTLAVSNAGPSDASGVEVTDQLPSGYTYVSDNGAYDDATGIWTVGALANGATSTLNITATVEATGNYTNTAQVSALNETDPNAANDQASSTTFPGDTVADLSMAKGVDNPAPNVGSSVVFTVTATNLGPDNATGVEVTDQLPTGYTYVSDNGGGAYNNATGVWTIGALANGGSVTLNITATVNASGDYTNIAQISATNETDSDPANNLASASATPGAVTDLSMAKSAGNPTPDVGGFVVFALTATNLGPSDATGVQVTDQLPTGYTYVSDNGSGAYDNATGVWTIGSLANGASAMLSITATVEPSGDYTNVAQVSGSETDPVSANDQASATTTPSPLADLSLAKSVDNPLPGMGSNVVFTLTVSNAGPSDASGVEVTDQLPSGYTYVSDDSLGAYNSSTGVWTAGAVANGASAMLKITATVNVSGVYLNTAQLTGSNETDPNAANDQSSATTTPHPVADLAMAKGVDNPTPTIGGFVVFTMTATNLGPSDATGVLAADQLPTGYTYVSDNGAGAYNMATGIWTIGALANGASAALNITATVNPAGDYLNVAQFAGLNESDPNAANDQASIATIPGGGSADLSLAMSVDNSAPTVGSDVVFTLTTTNLGPSGASGVVVTDQLPTGYTYVSDTGSGAYDDATGAWTIGAIANGAFATLNITATVNPSGIFDNVAQVSAANEVDPVPANNQASASTNPDPPPLCTTETQNLSGQTVSSTVTVTGCSITAGNGYIVANGGDVTFSAKTFIALTNGFSVLTGGIFVAELDPAIP